MKELTKVLGIVLEEINDEILLCVNTTSTYIPKHLIVCIDQRSKNNRNEQEYWIPKDYAEKLEANRDYIKSHAVTDPEEMNQIRETFWRTAITSQELPPSWWERWTARILRRDRK